VNFDPAAILLGIVLLVAFLVVGSRFFPEDMRLDPWRYKGPPDRPAGGEADDEAKFRWDEPTPTTPPDRDR
jgi:hypothetical protein